MHQQIAGDALNSLGDDGIYFDGGIRYDENITATLYNGPLTLEQIMKSFYYGTIGRENLKYVVQELRRHFIGYLEYHIAPGDDIWREFIHILAEMTSIPPSSLEKAEDITDIINILKRGKFGECHFRAYSCLMETVRQIDSNYSRSIDPLYSKIVMLHKQYMENEKAEKTSPERSNRLTEDDEATTSLIASHDGEAKSSEEDDDGDDDFCLQATTHSLWAIETNECYICGSKMYGCVSFVSKMCDGCRSSIPKRKRRETI